MNIVVLVKQVPDTGAERTLSPADHRLDREDADLVLDEINERAAEEALSLKETVDAHITVVSMGPDSALEAVRKVLAMGADRGIHVCDDRLRGADVVTTAKVLAAAVRTVENVDLVLMRRRDHRRSGERGPRSRRGPARPAAGDPRTEARCGRRAGARRA